MARIRFCLLFIGHLLAFLVQNQDGGSESGLGIHNNAGLKLINKNALWLGSVVSYGAIETIQTLETADESSGPSTDILPRHRHGTYNRTKKFIKNNYLWVR